MRYLVTGGAGFLGSNLAAEILKRDEELLVFDNLSRFGSKENLLWLQEQGQFEFVGGDTKEAHLLQEVVAKFKPDVIFHLAGQVAMTTSIQNPRLDFETNVCGGINLLEAVRLHSPHAAVFYSSTNKVYGDFLNLNFKEEPTRYSVPTNPNGFDENTPLNFQSPYGCSKGATDQYMLDYARIFGLKTCVFRHSSIFGGRQFATFDQGWIGWFVDQAIKTKAGQLKEPFTISGNGKQVRDVLFASDIVDCYFSALEKIDQIKGEVFNIGGGMNNSMSLLELFKFLEKELGVNLNFNQLPWRASDQKVFVADITKAKKRFSWQPKITKEAGLRQMIDWVGMNA